MLRLKTRPQFQAVLAGALIARTAHFGLHRCPLVSCESVANGDESPAAASLFPFDATWLSAMVPKRSAKRAVTRNAIKRLAYKAALDFSGQLPKAAFVVRLRREFARSTFPSASSSALMLAAREELQALFESGINAS